MNSFAIICISSCILATASPAKLPSFVTRCNFNDEKRNDCILKSFKAAWPKLYKGDKSIHLHSYDPIEIPQMHVDVGGNLIVDLRNAKITGLSNFELEEINIDFGEKTLKINFFVENINLLGQYNINGRILLLPIKGNGNCNITYIDGNCTFRSKFDIHEKKGNHYLKLSDSIFPHTVQRAYFGLDNLFDGNKLLGDQMLLVLNENWKDVNAEIGVKIGEALGEVIGTTLNDMFAKVPLEEMFIDYKYT